MSTQPIDGVHTIRTIDYDPVAGTILLRSDANPRGRRVTATGDDERVMLAAFHEQLAAAGRGGGVASLVGALSIWRAVREFAGLPIDEIVQRFIDADNAATGATLRSYVARAFADGDRLAHDLRQVCLPNVRGDRTEAWPEDVTAAIEQAAREAYLALVARHKARLELLGVDTTDIKHLLLTHEDLRTIARATPAELRTTEQRQLLAGTLPATYPTTDDLAAVAIHLVLAEHRGMNWSMIQSLTHRSAKPSGVTSTPKARTRKVWHLTSTPQQLHTVNGIVTHMASITMFARHQRSTMARDPVSARNADLLWVPAGAVNVLPRVSSAPWAKHLQHRLGLDDGIGARRARATAVLRGARSNRRIISTGHTEATAATYLAAAMPHEQQDALVIDSQRDIVRTAQKAVADRSAPAPSHDDDQRSTIDRGLATCHSGGIDPDTDNLCNKGILGCFFCPSARIADEHAGALAAMRAFTDHVRQVDADEWSNGPAPLLNILCDIALDVIGTDLDAPHDRAQLPIAAAHYYEVRAT